MKTNKKNLAIVLISSFVLLLGIGTALTFLEAVPVDPNSCFDSDGGLNFITTGAVNFTMNGTSFGPYIDTCYNNTNVYEFACSNDIPSLNLSDYALLATENCQIALNRSNATCSQGRCI